MNAPTKQYQFTFVADGIATSVTVDVSLAPFSEDFKGKLPNGVILPDATSLATGDIPGVTATLVGTQVTLTFPTPPPENDGSGNLIVYTASFQLTFAPSPAFYTQINWNVANVCTGTVGGGNKIFQLPGTPQGPVVVVVSGLIQIPGTDYTLVGTTLTFTNAPAASPIAFY